MEDVDLVSARGPVVSELLQKAPVRLVQFTARAAAAAAAAATADGCVQGDPSAAAVGVAAIAAVAVAAIVAVAAAIAGSSKVARELSVLLEGRASEQSRVPRFLGFEGHVNTALLQLPGARLLFGGRPVEGREPPPGFGLFQPTAVQLSLQLLLENEDARKIATTEVFGPLQVVVEWADGDEPSVASLTQQLPHHLTAAIVSRAAHTLQFFLQASGSGTTYAGVRARTTGAPQNHFFGPGGDPRGASIGTPQAIRDTWTFHR
ncbi:hypothetical protein ACSSS7_008155 [Eimeria intestinalis]